MIGPPSFNHRIERPVLPTLADRLKTETRALHIAAERTTFMGLLLGGRMSRSTYCRLLRNLQVIYGALEPALERHARHPLLAPIFQPALFRASSLAADLRVLQGDGRHDDSHDIQPATHDYVKRLSRIDGGEPDMLLAHAYVRYLGDLSGGQLLRGIVSESLALQGGAGASFYDFGGAAETRALAQAFRDGLGRVVVSIPKADALIAEASLSFKLHTQLFKQLASF
jgi:heme oxygenase